VDLMTLKAHDSILRVIVGVPVLLI